MKDKSAIFLIIIVSFLFSCKSELRTCANCTIPDKALYIIEAKKGTISKVYYSVLARNNTYQFINLRDSINYLLNNGYTIDSNNIIGGHILPPIGRNIDLAFDSFKKIYPKGSCKKFQVDCDKCDASNCVCCQ